MANEIITPHQRLNQLLGVAPTLEVASPGTPSPIRVTAAGVQTIAANTSPLAWGTVKSAAVDTQISYLNISENWQALIFGGITNPSEDIYTCESLIGALAMSQITSVTQIRIAGRDHAKLNQSCKSQAFRCVLYPINYTQVGDQGIEGNWIGIWNNARGNANYTDRKSPALYKLSTNYQNNIVEPNAADMFTIAADCFFAISVAPGQNLSMTVISNL
jgi:hypothetical protein